MTKVEFFARYMISNAAGSEYTINDAWGDAECVWNKLKSLPEPHETHEDADRSDKK